MNILLTCAGRRSYLVNYFKDAVGERGSVLAVDASANAAALQEADTAFTVPLVSDPGYLDALIEICREQTVHLLLSLNDLELPLIARERDRFIEVDTLPIVSSPHVVDLCFDKWTTAQFIAAQGLRGPRTYVSVAGAHAALERGDVTFPLVLKPRWGSASIETVVAEDDEELQLAYQLIRKRLPRTILAAQTAGDPDHAILIQERLEGQEYGLDVINDLDGKYVTTFVKQKIRMRAGETDLAITVENEQLSALGGAIGQSLGHIGNLDCDVFLNDDGCSVLEMNPRFGGGYPFSHMAGANLPAALIAWSEGRTPDPSWLRVKPNVMSAKHDHLIIIDTKLKG